MIMGLLHRDVTLLNFDDVYPKQRQLARLADEWIHLTDIREANLFCTDRSRSEISRRLSRRKSRGITFIGNGNYHYVTYLLLREINKPFSLILFDNHTDAKTPDGLPGLLTCGSWVQEAAKLPHLEAVFLIGVGERDFRLRETRGKITFWPDPRRGEELLSAIPTEHVYISIDKDVLDRAFAATNWDHGTMHLRDLLQDLRTLIRNKQVLGVDVCGELPVSPAEAWIHTDRIRLNERANLSILESVRA
ncbi:arginase family protein [Planifilum fimeticola]|nr:arginase family protein [Planifilum fimeticola]